MPLLPAFLLMAQGAQAVPTEVALHHRRPSAVLASLKGLRATLTPHDDRGTVGVAGAPADVEAARQVLRLADVPRRALRLRVTVESPADHLTWETEARLASGQKWRTADDETGTEIALEPRLEVDGTLVVMVLARNGKDEITSQMRLSKGRANTLDLGARRFQRVDVDRDGVRVTETRVPLPKVTVRYVGG